MGSLILSGNFQTLPKLEQGQDLLSLVSVLVAIRISVNIPLRRWRIYLVKWLPFVTARIVGTEVCVPRRTSEGRRP